MDLLARPTDPRIAEARQQIDQAVELQRRVDAAHPRLDEMLLTNAEIARAQGDSERARRELAEAGGRLREHHGAADGRAKRAAAELATLAS